MHEINAVIAGVLCILLIPSSSSSGGNYVVCYRMQLQRKRVDRTSAGCRTTYEKGKEIKNTKRPLNDRYQEINSTDLFGKAGYNTSTICEYHFQVKNVTKVKFYQVHLDKKPSDPLVGFRHCKDVAHPCRRDRDFIEMNTNTIKPRVLCGLLKGNVTRRIRPEDLSSATSELVITFWSDPSYVGKGFYGVVRSQ